jgi:hypothetical protein
MVDTTVYDNIDRDIVVVNKDTLTLKLERCKNFHNASNSAFGLGGIAISLLTSGYLTDTFRSVGPIPGETIRGDISRNRVGLWCCRGEISNKLVAITQ